MNTKKMQQPEESNKLDQDEVFNFFNQLNIDYSKLDYRNAQDYAQKFKRCTILKTLNSIKVSSSSGY